MYGQYGTFPPQRTLFNSVDNSSYTIPDDAFVAPPDYEGTILLETAIDDPEVVAHGDLIDAWAELSAYSVEAALAGRPDVFEFANNHCLLFAAIRSPIRLPIPPDLIPTDAALEQCVKDFNLPNHHNVFHAVSPVLPADPDAVYAMVKDAHELDLSIRGETKSASRSQSIPTASPDPGPDTKAADDSKPPTDVLMQWRTVGIVYVTMSTTPREVHIGVGLLPDYRGYGGAMTASAFAVQWAVETIQAHRVQARILASPHRERAQRLFTALGFAHEGLQRRTVTDAAGEWADVTHMGVLDTDWVVRKRRRAAPRSMWDDLFERHQREREELLRWDENRERMRLRRTSSMETVRMSMDAGPAGEEELFEPYKDDDSASSSQAASRLSSVEPPSSSSPSSSRFTTPSIGSDYDDERSLLRSPGSQAGDPFSDTEWVLASDHSDVSGSSDSEDLISRPESPEGWSF